MRWHSRGGNSATRPGLWVLLLILFWGAGAQAQAPSGDDLWTAPVNLSHSGTASDPALVAAPDGTLRVFWWDPFDGLTMTEGTAGNVSGQAWTPPAALPIYLVETVEGAAEGETEQIFTPIEAMPLIVGDATGRAHAFWLGEPDEETGARPLMASRLDAGSTSWTWAAVLAESAALIHAAAGPSGTLHLVYVRALDTARAPAGLYYRRSNDGGFNWSAPVAIHASRYLRLLTPETAHLGVAADGAGGVSVVWNDPRQERAWLAHSPGGGDSWGEPLPVDGGEGPARQPRLQAGADGELQVLWEDPRVAGACGLYQTPVSALLAGGAAGGHQALEAGLLNCPAGEQFLTTAGGSVLMVADAGDGALALAAWDGKQWQGSVTVSLPADGVEPDRALRPADLQAALVAPPADETGAETAEQLIVAGTDDQGDVWIAASQSDPLAWLAPTPAPTVDPAAAQTGPVNLSRSGAAASPAIVGTSDGKLHAFWWDQFDGLTAAVGTLAPSLALTGTLLVWSEPAPVEAAIPEGARFLPGAAGRLHAFWIDGEDIGPLMHSRTVGGAGWSLPVALAEEAIGFDVAAGESGVLHLAYLRAGHTPDAPAGLYTRRSADGGARWDDPVAVETSRYYRLLTPETAHLRLAAGVDGAVYLAWDEPRESRATFARSTGGGSAWQPLGLVGDAEGQPQHGRIATIPDGMALLLWEDGRFGGCNLYQAPAGDNATGFEGQRVLADLTTCPENERFLSLDGAQVLMVAGAGSDALTLAAWDGADWSELKRLSYRFEDPASGGQVYLGDLQVALVEGPEGWTLVVAGSDGNGDVWAVPGEGDALALVYAPPSPWSEPESFSGEEAVLGLPALAFDAEGRLHALWRGAETAGGEAALTYARRESVPGSGGQEARWSRPAQVLASPLGDAREPSLVAAGEHLHAVWSGGPEGEVFYSRAFLSDATAAGGWSDPVPLPAPFAVGSAPQIAVDPGGVLHAVYAVPLNEGRGIYHTRSDDGGRSWSLPVQVFDAAAAGWAAVDASGLAVDPGGLLHVVWVRAALPGGGSPQGVYYSRSVDGGASWSEAFEVVEGAADSPRVAATGPAQMHLLWREGESWWHRRSVDGEQGQGWSRAERVPGFQGVAAPVGLVADGAGALHLLGLGQDEAGEAALIYAVWQDEGWGERETFRLAGDDTFGVVAALLPALGRLEAAFGGEAQDAAGTSLAALWHTGRAVPAVVVTPVPTFTPPPTAAPSPTPTPAVTPRPTVDLSGVLPSGEGSVEMSLILSGGLAAVIVVGIFGARWLWAGRR